MANPVGRNPLAIIALVFGILSLCGGMLSPLGLGFGYFALKRAREESDAGGTQARAALILSLVGLVITGPLLVILLKYSLIPNFK